MHTAIPMNFIFAFSASGDIAFYLANNFPKRRHDKVYTGCQVLDGTTSEDDWVGWVKPRDLPLIVNPKKGFFVTTNNRQMPDNVKSDIGATSNSNTRARRATEMIQAGIDSGHKFDYKDMLTIMNDTVDVNARDNMPMILNLAR